MGIVNTIPGRSTTVLICVGVHTSKSFKLETRGESNSPIFYFFCLRQFMYYVVCRFSLNLTPLLSLPIFGILKAGWDAKK